MEKNLVNTNSSPSNQEEEVSSREAGGWKSVKYIIGICYIPIIYINVVTNMIGIYSLNVLFFFFIKVMSPSRNWRR
jgi:hypothetical protein